MKKVSLLLLTTLLGLGLSVQSQKIIEKNIAHNGQFIELDVKFADTIEIKTWDKQSIYFKAEIEIEDNEFIDKYEVDFDESKNTIYIEEKAEAVFKAFRKQASQNGNGKHFCNTGDWYTFNYVLHIPKNARFKVSSINGDLSANILEGDGKIDLINGSIAIKKYSGNLDLNTINGEIDLNVGHVSFVAETIHGDIYADEKLDLDFSDRHVGHKVESSRKNLADRLKLNTINGNMYLRL